MAIEVINREPHPDVLKTVRCRHCGWEHRYAPIDVQSAVQVDVSGSGERWWYIRCHNPICIPRERYLDFTGDDPNTFGSYQTNYIQVKRP